MPVYIRTNVSYTPPSLYNMEMEDDSDYLLDPDQMRDILPQPYRMINKILIQLLDTVWDIVETKENAILAEARKVRPPRFDEAQELEVFSNATTLEASTDGTIIFVGLPNGLAAMEALTQTAINVWEEERVEITSIKCYSIGEDFYLLITLDDMATARLFLFGHDLLMLVKTMNENAPEHASKLLVHKCEASADGEYMGIVFEQTGTKETWLEIHKLPVENWVKDLDNIGAALEKHKADEEETLQTDHGTEVGTSKPGFTRLDTPPVSIVEKLSLKFSPPSSVLKVKPPQQIPLPANASSSIASAVSKVDTGDVLGTGTQHVLGAAHLESRDAMFRHRHESMLEYLSEETEEISLSPVFHFVNASCMIPFGLEPNQPVNSPVAVAVWWKGSPHLCQYSLLRTGKDIDFKPELVWPFTCPISSSAVSPCTTHLAVGLENGNIILWNRQMGLHKAVLSASSESPVRSVRFLDPCLFPMDYPHYPPYPTQSATFLLAECSDGTQMLFDTCDGSQQIPRCIAEMPENDGDMQTLLKVVPKLPELMLYIQKNGNMFIKDIGTGSALCQIAVPPTHHIQAPWDPIFAFGSGGQLLFLKGEGTEMDEEGNTSDISKLFLYHLRSYPVFDSYWSQEHPSRSLAVFTTQEQRICSLLKERMMQQALRKPRLQERWSKLRSELDIIQQARKIPVDSLRISTPTSITSIPEELKFRPSRARVL